MAKAKTTNGTSKEKQSGKKSEKREQLVGWDVETMPDFGITDWMKRRQKQESGLGVPKKLAQRECEPYLCQVSKKCTAILDIHAFLDTSLSEQLRPRTRPKKDLNNNGNDAQRGTAHRDHFGCNGLNCKVHGEQTVDNGGRPTDPGHDPRLTASKSCSECNTARGSKDQNVNSGNSSSKIGANIHADDGIRLPDDDTGPEWKSPALEARKHGTEISTGENPETTKGAGDRGADNNEYTRPSIKFCYSQSNITLKKPYEERTHLEGEEDVSVKTERRHPMMHRPLLGNYNLANRGLHSKSTGSLDTLKRDSGHSSQMSNASVSSFKMYKAAHHPDAAASAKRVALILQNMNNLIQKQARTGVTSSEKTHKLFQDGAESPNPETKQDILGSKRPNGFINLNLDVELPPRAQERSSMSTGVTPAPTDRPNTRSKSSAQVGSKGKGFAFSDLLPVVDTSLRGILANASPINADTSAGAGHLSSTDFHNTYPAFEFENGESARDPRQWDTRQQHDSPDKASSILGPPAFRPVTNKTPLHRAKETTQKRLIGQQQNEEDPPASEVRWKSSTKGMFSQRGGDRKSAPLRSVTKERNGLTGRNQQTSSRSEPTTDGSKRIKNKSKSLEYIRKTTSVCDFRRSVRPTEDLLRFARSNTVK